MLFITHICHNKVYSRENYRGLLVQIETFPKSPKTTKLVKDVFLGKFTAME